MSNPSQAQAQAQFPCHAQTVTSQIKMLENMIQIIYPLISI